jgi:hypothetical protein
MLVLSQWIKIAYIYEYIYGSINGYKLMNVYFIFKNIRYKVWNNK